MNLPAPHYADDAVTLYAGDCLAVLPTLPDASVDAVCTDPPYGLEFMGKDWDSFKTTGRTQRLNRRRDPVAYLTAAGEDLGLFDEDPS